MDSNRVKMRLKELGMTQFDAAKATGKDKHFLYDFLAGRKKSIKGDGPWLVAQALQCSMEYLAGEADEIGVPPVGPPPAREPKLPASKAWQKRLPVAGIVEAGRFFKTGSRPVTSEQVEIAPHPSHAPDTQKSFRIRGDDLEAIGATEAGFLTVVPAPDDIAELKNGAIAIVKHTRLGGTECEISAREIQHYPDRLELLTRPKGRTPDVITVRDGKTDELDGRVEIIGIAVATGRPF